MRLLDALRLEKYALAALVGAGGKSGALFQLGREYLEQGGHRSGAQASEHPVPSGSVILAAAAHLGVDQIEFADHHLIIEDERQIPDFEQLKNRGLLVVTGPQIEAQRVAGLSPAVIDRLYRTVKGQAPLLVEADGSKRRPLKAPAQHEPVIPEWIEVVVVTAGLSGIGRPLSDEWVHRPELFGGLAGIPQETIITTEHLARVLCSPDGGLKGIPESACRVALLNQANTPEVQSSARRLSEKLLEEFQAVVIADLPPAIPGSRFPADQAVYAVHEKIAGVILAAGRSSRFGRPKQILEWKGKPFVRLIAETSLAGGLSPVVVVVGSAAEDVIPALEGLPVKIEINPDWESGQASSIAAGVEALPSQVGGAIFMVADQPMLPVSLLRGLVELHAAEMAPIVAPLVDGQRANPVLFDRKMFEALQSLSGDVGGRALFSRVQPVWLTWSDPAVLMDVDTPEDYARILASIDRQGSL